MAAAIPTHPLAADWNADEAEAAAETVTELQDLQSLSRWQRAVGGQLDLGEKEESRH